MPEETDSWLEWRRRLIDSMESHEDILKRHDRQLAFFQGALALGGFLIGGGILSSVAYALLSN